MAAVNLGGFFFGALIGLLSAVLGDTGLRFVIVIILLCFTGISVFLVAEPTSSYTRGETQSLGPKVPLWRSIVHFFTVETWQPFASRDFRLVFASRFLFQVSVSTMQQYLQVFRFVFHQMHSTGSLIALFWETGSQLNRLFPKH
jgi:hypothetical protein